MRLTARSQFSDRCMHTVLKLAAIMATIQWTASYRITRLPRTCAASWILICLVAAPLLAVEPLEHAHAHNDYWHEHPLADALDHGFTSVEADVFLVDGQLLVGHEQSELTPDRSLESLYLDPLARRVRQNAGRVYANGSRFILMIDVKSDADATYRRLQVMLPKYAEMLSKVDHGKLQPGAVTIVLSGNRPTTALVNSDVRFAGLDGRLSDLDSNVPAHLLPMISDAWPEHFSWRGSGPMPDEERTRLRAIVQKAHKAHRIVRFWATPESPDMWRELRSADVDLISSDQLDRLAAFLQSTEAIRQRAVCRVTLPERPQLELKLLAKLGPGPGEENSGIVKSRHRNDVFWIHNDSGDEPRIYAVDRHGKSYPSERYPSENGVLIGGAINVDWEDITIDDDGQIIVADVGNNANDRRDLVLYYLDEPRPTAGRTTFQKKVFIRYPNQRSFPADRDEFNFDCEAVFTVGKTVYFLSKDRSDEYTNLYRLDEANPNVTNVLTLLDTFDIHGQAVGADCTPDGRRLAVLTYTAVWLFERSSLDQSFFTQRVFWAPFAERDAEAICFADDKTLLIADESLGELYEVATSELSRVQ
jgi:hypothetical protein